MGGAQVSFPPSPHPTRTPESERDVGLAHCLLEPWAMRSLSCSWELTFGLGKATWPGVSLGFADYRSFGESAGVESASPNFAASDFWLACACRLGDARAIDAFERLHMRAARSAIARTVDDAELVEDVCQELRQKLLAGPDARLATYRGQGPLKAWVCVAATRLAIQISLANKKVSRRLHTAHLSAQPASFVDPEVALLEQRYCSSFQAELNAALASLPRKHRNVLRMKVIEGLSIDEIARPYRVNRATVSKWIKSARVAIFRAMKGRLTALHVELDSRAFLSVARAVQNQLHLSLSRLVASGDETMA
jgi:RNA polymerase sigma-70 factor, ECF subfamily